jgi:hypothetical protein
VYWIKLTVCEALSCIVDIKLLSDLCMKLNHTKLEMQNYKAMVSTGFLKISSHCICQVKLNAIYCIGWCYIRSLREHLIFWFTCQCGVHSFSLLKIFLIFQYVYEGKLHNHSVISQYPKELHVDKAIFIYSSWWICVFVIQYIPVVSIMHGYVVIWKLISMNWHAK